jgi:hypothetical protein
MTAGPCSPDGALQQRAIAIIKPLIPVGAKERVARAVAQNNRIIRGQIREATGLNLGEGEGHGSVPVRVQEGFPAEVASLIGKYPDPVLWRLISLQSELDRAAEGLSTLCEFWEELGTWPRLPVPKDSDLLLSEASYIISGLQDLAEATKIFADLKQIHEDILGAYHFGPRGSHIVVYWMAQALFSAAFGVGIEGLTAVTLAHELAHAYTHLGRDIDGVSWHNSGFAQSDKSVVEGLAQHYTAEAMERLKARIPNGTTSYRALLECQSGPYRAHESWFDNLLPRRGEIVRFTMLRARNHGRVNDAEWRALLKETQERLTTTRAPPTGPQFRS